MTAVARAAAPVVELTGARVVRGARTVLDVPALAVLPGEVLGVIGPNGAGKSTLLRLLGLLETPAEGSFHFRGQPARPADGLSVRRRMASVFQDPLLADTSVWDNVALGLKFRGVAQDVIAERVSRWLQRFGIASLGRRRARTLSGGEAQRAALARALVLEPELLLLDEPFSALDQPTREALIGDLRGILRAERITTVLVTHHRGEALALADRVAVLIDGRLLQVGDPASVFRAPTCLEVARFVGHETIVECEVIPRHGLGAALRAGAHTIEAGRSLPSAARVFLCLRPEDVSVRPEDAMETPALPGGTLNQVRGRVAQVMPAPLHVRVVVDCGFPLVALVSHRSMEEWKLGEGAPVTAEWSASATHLIPAPRVVDDRRERDPACLDSPPRPGV